MLRDTVIRKHGPEHSFITTASRNKLVLPGVSHSGVHGLRFSLSYEAGKEVTVSSSHLMGSVEDEAAGATCHQSQ